MGGEIDCASFTPAGREDMRQLGYFVEDGKGGVKRSFFIEKNV